MDRIDQIRDTLEQHRVRQIEMQRKREEQREQSRLNKIKQAEQIRDSREAAQEAARAEVARALGEREQAAAAVRALREREQAEQMQVVLSARGSGALWLRDSTAVQDELLRKWKQMAMMEGIAQEFSRLVYTNNNERKLQTNIPSVENVEDLHHILVNVFYKTLCRYYPEKTASKANKLPNFTEEEFDTVYYAMKAFGIKPFFVVFNNDDDAMAIIIEIFEEQRSRRESKQLQHYKFIHVTELNITVLWFDVIRMIDPRLNMCRH
jgi:carboxylesterase type B